MTIVCPERDTECPHGDACPYALDRYTCKPGSFSEYTPDQVKAAIAAMRPKQHHAIGKWLSAALEDPSTCEEMKADIRAWFDAGEPSPVRPTLSPEDRARMKTVAEEIRGYAGHDAPWLAKRADELLSLIDKLTEAG